MSRFFNRVCVAILMMLVSAAAAFGQNDGNSLLAPGFDQASREGWEFEIQHQMQAFSSAYGLDPQLQTLLQNELQARLIAQVAYDRQTTEAIIRKTQELEAAGLLENEEAPEVKALNAQMAAQTFNAPLNEERVADWLEQRLPAAVATEGRQRLREVRDLRLQRHLESEYAFQAESGAKRELGEALVQGSGLISPDGDTPLPNDPVNDRYYTEIRVRDVGGEVIVAPGRKGSPVNDTPMPGELTKAERLRQAEIEAAEREGRRKPGPAGLVSPSHEMTETPAHESIVVEQPPAPQVTVQVAPTTPAGQPTGRAAPAVPAAKEVVYAKAPPLDDWDKYVQEHAKKVGFDDAQMTRAQAVLKDLKRRANQYRMSRSDQFAVAALKTDAKERDAMMKELNKPIDAMFDELKQRIDSLMTLEQRQKAAAGKK